MTGRRSSLILACALLLAGCGAPVAAQIPLDESPTPSTEAGTPSPTGAAATLPAPTSGPADPTPLPENLALDPSSWHTWPVLPIVPERARAIFQAGQALGRDAHAFSVFGDCQTEPDVFLGPFETDPELVSGLAGDLQETVEWFRGSFNRDGPTTEGGATTAALLWAEWHHNAYTCTPQESPLQCELRIHNPAFVIIQVGSHYETRNDQYMRMILDQLIEAGVVPILASKADNRDQDEHVNLQYAQLAVEYNLPFWNFWAALEDLPNRGLFTLSYQQNLGDIYLTDEAKAIHRLTALETLDRVRRAVLDE